MPESEILDLWLCRTTARQPLKLWALQPCARCDSPDMFCHDIPRVGSFASSFTLVEYVGLCVRPVSLSILSYVFVFLSLSYIYIYMYIYIYTYINKYVYIYIQIHIYIYIDTYIHTYIHTYIYIYIYPYMYIHTNIHAHICLDTQSCVSLVAPCLSLHPSSLLLFVFLYVAVFRIYLT